MEDLEYLEEYADMVLPAMQPTSNQNPNMGSDDDSSSIDQDIFESIFDDRSSDDDAPFAVVDNEKQGGMSTVSTDLPATNMFSAGLADTKGGLPQTKAKIVLQNKPDVSSNETASLLKEKLENQTKTDNNVKTIATIRPTLKIEGNSLLKSTTTGINRPIVISNSNQRNLTTAGRQVPTSTSRLFANNQAKTTNASTVGGPPSKKVTKSVKSLKTDPAFADPMDSDSYDSDMCESCSGLTDDSDCESFSNDDDLYEMNDFNSDLSDEEMLKLNKSPSKLAKVLYDTGSPTKVSANNQIKLNLKASEQKRPIFTTEASQERHIEMLFDQEIDPKSPTKAKEKDVREIVKPIKVAAKKEELTISNKTAIKKPASPEKGKNIKVADKKVTEKIVIDGKIAPKKDLEPKNKQVGKKIEIHSREKDIAQKRQEIEGKKIRINEKLVEKKRNVFEDLKTRLEEFKKSYQEKNKEKLAQAKESKKNNESAKSTITTTTTNVVKSKEVLPKIVIKSKQALGLPVNTEESTKNKIISKQDPTKSPEILKSPNKCIEENKQIETNKPPTNAHLEENKETSIIQISPKQMHIVDANLAQKVCDQINNIEKRVKEMDTLNGNTEVTAETVEPAKPVATRRKRKQVLDIIKISEPSVQTNDVNKVAENGKRRKIDKNNSVSSKRGRKSKAKASELALESPTYEAPQEAISPTKLPKAPLYKNVLNKLTHDIKTTTETTPDTNEATEKEHLPTTELLVEKRQSPRLILTNTPESKDGDVVAGSSTKRGSKKKAQLPVQIRKDGCRAAAPLLYDSTTPKSTLSKKTAKQKRAQPSKPIIKSKEKYGETWFNCTVRVDRDFVQKYLQAEKNQTPKTPVKRVTFCLEETDNISQSPPKTPPTPPLPTLPIKDASAEKKVFSNALPKEMLSGRAQVFTIPPQHRRAPETQTNTNTEIVEQNLPTKEVQATETAEIKIQSAAPTTKTTAIETITNTTITTRATMTTPEENVNSVILIGKPDSKSPTDHTNSKEKSVYSFYRPVLAKHDHILLDDCCPLVDPSMPAVSDMPKTAHIQQQVIDLPAFITMKTKIITRNDLNQKRGEIPSAVKNRVEELTAHVQNNQKERAVIHERMFVRQSLLGIDKMLKREVPLISAASFAERQKAIDQLTQTQNYKPADVVMAKAILQKYFNTLNKVRDEAHLDQLATMTPVIVNNITATNTEPVNEVKCKSGAKTVVVLKNPDERKSLPAVKQVRAKKPACSSTRRTTIDAAPSTSMPELRQHLERKSIIVTRTASIQLPNAENKGVLVVNAAMEDGDEAMDPEVILPDIIRDENVSIVKDENIEDDFIG